MSVVTLNLWHDKADWPARQAHILATLRELQPDVIALQEVLQHAQLPNQAQTLADGLGYRYLFASVDAPEAERRYGNAILTRHPILAHDSKPLQPLDDYRSVAHARIALGDDTLDVYATHLHHTVEGGAIRRAQVADLMAWIEATAPADATLVLGDFNTAADAPELAVLRARFRDAYGAIHPDAASDASEHGTLNPAMQHAPLRIDHVLFDPRGLSVRSARRLFDAPMADGGWASDHFGVLATFEIRKVPPASE